MHRLYVVFLQDLLAELLSFDAEEFGDLMLDVGEALMSGG